MFWGRCVSLWKRKYLFRFCLGFLKEDTTTNQWLSCIYITVPEQFNPNIRECAAHFTKDYVLNLEEQPTMLTAQSLFL